MNSDKTNFVVITKGQKINKVTISIKEEEEIRFKIFEALSKFKTIYGDIKGLSFENFTSLCQSPGYESIKNLNIISSDNLNLSEIEIMVRMSIVKEEFEKNGIVW